MITGPLDAGVPASWVAGDEVYGADPSSEPAWGPGASGRCWWWPATTWSWPAGSPGVPTGCSGGCRRGPGSASRPARAPRATAMTTGRLSSSTLARVTLQTPGSAGCWCAATARPGSWPSTLLDAPPHPAGRPGHGGRAHPDQQGPVWPGPASGPPLALLVPLDDPCLARHAFLVVAALADNTRHPGLISLTCNQLQHLFAALLARPAADPAHRLRWSLWRRRQQARACHYHRQANRP